MAAATQSDWADAFPPTYSGSTSSWRTASGGSWWGRKATCVDVLGRQRAWDINRVFGNPGQQEIGPRLAGAWKQVLAADRPVVLDVHTDATVPPIPSLANLDQITEAARQTFLPGTKDA